jgi:hypothetical protein
MYLAGKTLGNSKNDAWSGKFLKINWDVSAK